LDVLLVCECKLGCRDRLASVEITSRQSAFLDQPLNGEWRSSPARA
jgi:hypothetical protein